MKFFSIASLFCHDKNFLSSRELRKEYDLWGDPQRNVQRVSISILTAVLYIHYFWINTLFIDEPIISLMRFWHLYCVVPLLFLVALLSYFKLFSNLTRILLFIAPIVAALANSLFVTEFQAMNTYLTELYLIIFWILTVSSLRFFDALVSATFVIFLSIYFALYHFTASDFEIVMHVFWIASSFSFGVLTAFLKERIDIKLFLQGKNFEVMAVTDKLTGLFNRTKLDQILKQHLQEEQTHFALAIIDIDYFKEVNDLYGHQKGDMVLKQVSEILQNNTRKGDVVVRWGGEEFIVLLFGIDKDNLFTLFEKLRESVASYPFEEVGQKTVSIGVTMSKEGDSMDTIISRADTALYRAKKDGRDRVEYIF